MLNQLSLKIVTKKEVDPSGLEIFGVFQFFFHKKYLEKNYEADFSVDSWAELGTVSVQNYVTSVTSTGKSISFTLLSSKVYWMEVQS